MTEYIAVKKMVPIFNSLPKEEKLTIEDVYAYYDQYPNNPRERLARDIDPLVHRLRKGGGCKVAVKWVHFDKWARCRKPVLDGEDLCELHGGSDQAEHRKEQARIKRITYLKAELARLEGEAP